MIYYRLIKNKLKVNLIEKELIKQNGKLVFIEPLGTNPFINMYRKLTPKSRSVDEHPLVEKDFRYLKSKFTDIKINYYGFCRVKFMNHQQIHF